MIITLKKARDFKNVYERGKIAASPLLVLYSLENNMNINRYGFSISKKVGNAVTRNKIRRCLKELIKSHEETGYDFVIVVRTRAGNISRRKLFCELRESLGYK